jgi:hypothetical protein
MVNVPNPIGLSTNTGFQLGKLWLLLILFGILLAIGCIIIQLIWSIGEWLI